MIISYSVSMLLTSKCFRKKISFGFQVKKLKEKISRILKTFFLATDKAGKYINAIMMGVTSKYRVLNIKLVVPKLLNSLKK